MPATTPTSDQNHSYGECLRFDALKAAARRQGRSDYLSPADAAEHRRHSAIIAAAMSDGVCFDRMAFA